MNWFRRNKEKKDDDLVELCYILTGQNFIPRVTMTRKKAQEQLLELQGNLPDTVVLGNRDQNDWNTLILMKHCSTVIIQEID